MASWKECDRRLSWSELEVIPRNILGEAEETRKSPSQQLTCLWPLTMRSHPRSVSMGFVVDKVVLGKARLPVLQFPVSIIPPKLHNHWFIHHWRYITSTADSNVKQNSPNVNSLQFISLCQAAQYSARLCNLHSEGHLYRQVIAGVFTCFPQKCGRWQSAL